MPRLNLSEDVKPLSEFRANVAACITQVHRTRRPVVITNHGKSAAVLLDVSAYEGLMQKMEVLSDICFAEDQLAQGQGVSHEVALANVLSKVLR